MNETTEIQPNPEVSLWLIAMLGTVIKNVASGTMTDYDAADCIIAIGNDALKKNGTIN